MIPLATASIVNNLFRRCSSYSTLLSSLVHSLSPSSNITSPQLFPTPWRKHTWKVFPRFIFLIIRNRSEAVLTNKGGPLTTARSVDHENPFICFSCPDWLTDASFAYAPLTHSPRQFVTRSQRFLFQRNSTPRSVGCITLWSGSDTVRYCRKARAQMPLWSMDGAGGKKCDEKVASSMHSFSYRSWA